MNKRTLGCWVGVLFHAIASLSFAFAMNAEKSEENVSVHVQIFPKTIYPNTSVHMSVSISNDWHRPVSILPPRFASHNASEAYLHTLGVIVQKPSGKIYQVRIPKLYLGPSAEIMFGQIQPSSLNPKEIACTKLFFGLDMPHERNKRIDYKTVFDEPGDHIVRVHYYRHVNDVNESEGIDRRDELAIMSSPITINVLNIEKKDVECWEAIRQRTPWELIFDPERNNGPGLPSDAPPFVNFYKILADYADSVYVPIIEYTAASWRVAEETYFIRTKTKSRYRWIKDLEDISKSVDVLEKCSKDKDFIYADAAKNLLIEYRKYVKPPAGSTSEP